MDFRLRDLGVCEADHLAFEMADADGAPGYIHYLTHHVRVELDVVADVERPLDIEDDAGKDVGDVGLDSEADDHGHQPRGSEQAGYRLAHHEGHYSEDGEKIDHQCCNGADDVGNFSSGADFQGHPQESLQRNHHQPCRHQPPERTVDQYDSVDRGSSQILKTIIEGHVATRH